MSHYRKRRSEFIRPPHVQLPSAGLIMQVSEGAIAEVSEESKATCMFLIPVSMVTTYIDHERTPPLPEVSGFDHLITSTVLVTDLWWLGFPDGALPAKGE